MEVKNNIRQRRQDRIKSLQQNRMERLPESGLFQEPVLPYAPYRHELSGGTGDELLQPPALPRIGQPAAEAEREMDRDPRLEDPEYVWRLRQKELLGHYGYGDKEPGLLPRLDNYSTTDRLGRALPQTGGSRGLSGSYSTPPYSGSSSGPGGFVPSKRKIAVKLVASGLLFAFVWGMFQVQQPWAQSGQRFVRASLTEDFDFSRLTDWYRKTFSGAPSFLPTFGSSKEQGSQKVTGDTLRSFVQPVKGKVLESYASGHQWMIVQTGPGAAIRAIDTGRVTFAGVREPFGYTVVVQHSGGYQSTYGLLQPSALSAGDWLEAGDTIGNAAAQSGQAAGRLYVSVTKDMHAINPADVVTFD